MKEVAVTMWALTPEEVKELPKGTQLIEYDPFTQRMKVKQAGKGLYDFTCVYVLAVPTSGN